MPFEIPGRPIRPPYKYVNPDDAYKEAQHRIKKAKDDSAAELDLRRFGLTGVPPEIGELRGLRKLNLDYNKLTTAPPEIGQLMGLRVLWLNENQVKEIIPEICQLTELRELDLANNRLTAVPSEIVQLVRLTRLDINNNQLTVVPPEIVQLPALTRLLLSNNPIKDIPIWLGDLIQLQDLALDGLKLNAVPDWLGKLTNLKSLWLRNNDLKDVPPEITQLTKLENLDLTDNPKLLIPPEILEQWQNARAILDYLREQQEALARPLNEAKLILVGQGGVGKTSLVKRLLGQGFDEAENQTEGINIETWSLDVNRPQQGVVPITLNIWDFGGQEIMHATHQFFLTKRSLYLLVLDARQGEDEGRVEYWLALINSFAPDAPVLIVINKSDQHHLDINRRGLQEKYPAIKGSSAPPPAAARAFPNCNPPSPTSWPRWPM